MKTHAEDGPGADELDVSLLLFKLRRRWLLFVGALLLAGAAAFLYLRLSPPAYAYRATMLLGDQATGSKRAQELLELLEVKEKGLKMEDEVSLISSADMVRQAVRRLPYQVVYFRQAGAGPHQLNPVRELPLAAAPFEVVAAAGVPQLTGVSLRVTAVGTDQYRVRASADEGRLTDLSTGTLVRELGPVSLDQIVSAGQPLNHPLLHITLRPRQDHSAGKSRSHGAGQSQGQGAGTPADADAAADSYFFQLQDVNTAAARYGGTLVARPVDHESRIIELSVKNAVPEHAALFLDTLMAVYIAADLREKNQTGAKTLAFLDDKIGRLAGTRQQAAGALSSFRSTRGVVDVSTQSTAAVQRSGELLTATARAETSRRYFQNLRAYLQATRGAGQVASPSSAGIDDPVLNTLILKLQELNTQRAGLVVSASDNNPMVTIIDERIASTKQALLTMVSSLSEAADINLRAQQGQLNAVRGQLTRLPEDERQLTALQSKSAFNEKNYNFLVEKRNEAAIALASNATDKRVVDPARPTQPGPESPKPLLVGLLALLAGLLGPTALVLLLDQSNRTIQGQEDLARLTSIPLLGVVAHGAGAAGRRLLPTVPNPVTESFRSIRVNFQYLAAGPGRQVLGITSSVPGEGKTFCAVHLAAELAASGRRVVLVEADLRRPSLAGYFDGKGGGNGNSASSGPGLTSLLQGEHTLAECLSASGLPGVTLDLLPCGTPTDNPIVLLESPRMAALLAELRAAYDYVVIDTPPVGFVAEYFVLLPHFEANIYVVRHNYTDRDMLKQINALYQDQKIKDLYLVINDVRFNQSYEYRYKAKAYAYAR